MDPTTNTETTPFCTTPGNDDVTTAEPDGISQGGDVPELTRYKLLNEWIRNESEFIACLNSLEHDIALPILDQIYMDPSCTDTLPGLQIFLSTVKLLKNAHSIMLQHLEKVSRSWCDRSSTLGDVIAHQVGIIRILLRPYSSGIGIAAASIRRNIHDPTFMPSLITADLKEESLKILSNPLTRLPYYEYMLRRLLDRTDLDHSDHSLLSRAIKFVRSASKHIANAAEICRQRQSVRALEDVLDLNLMEPNRTLLLKGELVCSFDDQECSSSPGHMASSFSKIFQGKRRPFLSDEIREYPVFAILFNDIMMLSRKLSDGKRSVFDVIPLHCCSVNVSGSPRQKVLNVKCQDARVYHLHCPQLAESSHWMESVLKAHTDAIIKPNEADGFRTDVIYRNEYCQLRIAQQSVIITSFDKEPRERARLELHHTRLFSDCNDDCVIQLSSTTKHIIIYTKSARETHRVIQYVKMEQLRIRSLLPAPSDCCERTRAHSIQNSFHSCSLCNSYIVCSPCLNAATLLSTGGKSRSIVCRMCQKVYFQRIVGNPIPEIHDTSEENRDWFDIESSKSDIGSHEARRIRHSRRFGVTRLAELDVKPTIRIPRLEPEGCISAPLLKLRDDLCKPPTEPGFSEDDVLRVQCASCLEFKSIDNDNRFCGVCGHSENLINDRVAFLFSFHKSEKARVKQQMNLLNIYLAEVLNDANEPAQRNKHTYHPHKIASSTSFGKNAASAAGHLSLLEGKFIVKKSDRQIPCRNWVNSGAVSFSMSLKMILELYLLMLGELEERLHNWNSNSCLIEMLTRFFPHFLAVFRLLICNYYEAMERFSSNTWKFLFCYLQLQNNASVSALDMILMAFDRIRSFFLILYKESTIEGGCYHEQLLQISGGLTLLINRIHDRHISIRMARLLALSLPSYSSERLLYSFVVQAFVDYDAASRKLLILTNDVCILVDNETGEKPKLRVYTCRRSACNFIETVTEIAKSGIRVTAIEATIYSGSNRKRKVFIFGSKLSETQALLQTLLSWKNAPPKNMSSVTIHSPRFKSGKVSLSCHATSMDFSSEFSKNDSMERQCPSCGRICSTAFCSTCGSRTNQIASLMNRKYTVF